MVWLAMMRKIGYAHKAERTSFVAKKTEEDVIKRLEKSQKHYSEDKLWAKLKRVAKKAGSSAVYAVLLLYYTLQKPDVPKKTKALIVGALGYFILPFDLIPDMMLGVGYTDDFGALVIALIQVSMYIDDEIKTKARTKLHDWFGFVVDTSDVDEKLI